MAGQVKTRLTPPLEPAQAMSLYTAFVEDVVETVGRVAAAGDRTVLAAPGGLGPVLAAIAARHGFEAATQEGADLGARMRHAIGGELARGARSVVLVGSDSPTLPAREIRRALAALGRERPGAFAVLGPAGDGGYWLVGAAGGRNAAPPDLFEEIPWSTRDVLAATLRRARERRIELELLPFWYDVDDAADLRMLAAHIDWLEREGDGQGDGKAGSIPSRTKALIAELRASRPGFFLA